MAFEIVFPHDTQTDVDAFIEQRCHNRAEALEVEEALRQECEKLAANPTLGTVPLGTPFETRRIHRFRVTAAGIARTVEFLYHVNAERRVVVLTGFREVPPIPG